MADKKIIGMVLKVDLECERCKKKITRVLEKIKDKLSIDGFSFEEEKNLVIIYGPFDAVKVRRKLCCEAGRIIKGMEVVKVPEEKKTEEEEKKKDGGVAEEEEDGRKVATAPPANIRPLLEKMVERPNKQATNQPAPCTCCRGCSCCGGKEPTQPPAAQGVVVASPSVSPQLASSVSGGHVFEEAAPSYYYGVPVYSIEWW